MNISKLYVWLVLCVIGLATISNDKLFAQSVGIGDAADFTPDNTALLELQSVSRGFLMSRMTAAQRVGISAPSPETTPHGLMVIQTDDQPGQPPGLWYYYNDGTLFEWRNIINTNPAVTFGDITTGTNISATMTVGAGASLVPSAGVIRANEFVGTGSVTAAVDLNTSEVSGILTIDKGGTGTNVLPPAGGIIFSDGTSYNSTATGTSGQILVSDGTNPPSWQTPNFVTSVGLSLPVEFNVANSPVTDNGTLTATWENQNENLVFASPNGIAGTPTFRKIESADITSINASTINSGVLGVNYGGTGLNSLPTAGSILYSNGTEYVATDAPTVDGQILVYNLNTGEWEPQNPTLPSLDDGKLWIGDSNNDAIAREITGDGTISNAGVLTVTAIQGQTISSTAPTNGQILQYNDVTDQWEPVNPTSGGTVTSVGLDLPATVFSISGSPVTNSGTLTGSFINQNKQTVFAGPVDDPAAPPTFRLLEATDIPNLSTDKLTSGILPIARGGTNSGTALNNNRIMVSLGGSIVEASALTNGQLLIGSTGAAPVAGNITAATGSGVSVTNGAGTIALAITNNESGSAWNTLGNSGTTAATNFIGTTDAVDLTLRTNNTEKMRITSAGNVGIGENNPTQKLEIKDGNILLSNSGTAGELRLQETSAFGTNYTGFKADTLNQDLIYTMPKDTVNELAILVNEGRNKLKWIKTGDLQGKTKYNILEVINLASYNIPDTVTHVLVQRNGVSRVNLYSGAQYSGKVIFIKRLSSGNNNVVNICPASGQRIDGIALNKGVELANIYDSIMMVYDGSNWFIMSSYVNSSNNKVEECNCP